MQKAMNRHEYGLWRHLPGLPPPLVTTTPGLAPVSRSCAEVEIPSSISPGIDNGNRTGGIRFLDRTVTDHHSLLQHLGVGLHHDVEMFLTVDRHLHGVVAYIAHNQRRIRRNIDGEVAFNVGRHAVGGALSIIVAPIRSSPCSSVTCPVTVIF